MALTRAPYVWHLRPPFDQMFDCSHWWKGQEDGVDPVAALYELARRHPRVGERRSRFCHASWHGVEMRPQTSRKAWHKMSVQAWDDLGDEELALQCLCIIGLKSWRTLTWEEQDFWKARAGKMKGVDCRWDRFRDITVSALGWIHIRRVQSLIRQRVFKENLRENPISSSEMEASIAEQAIEAHRAGHLVFSFAPDLTRAQARNLLDDEYRSHRKLRSAPTQRTRKKFWKNWLAVIAAFEEAATAQCGVNSSGFNSYKRIIDGIRFAPEVCAALRLTRPA